MDWTVALWIVLMGVLFVLAPLGCAGGADILYVIVLAACVVSAAVRVVRGVFGKDDA